MVAADTELTWFGQPVTVHVGKLPELLGRLPRFERTPFGHNRFLHMVVRRPLARDERPVPVAAVSPQYELIQHRDVLHWLAEALKGCEEDPDRVTGRLTLSAYGERMELSVQLPQHDFDPGDGYPLKLEVCVLNSVDRTTALEIDLAWWREICSNGLAILEDLVTQRKVHLRGRKPVSRMADVLRNRLDHVRAQREVLLHWLNIPIAIDRLVRWADTTVAEAWGAHAAARVVHIAATGRDGRIEPRGRGGAPHELRVVDEAPVPGLSGPSDNAYHVSQILSWLASHRGTVQQRHERTARIPRLMAALFAAEQP